MIYIDKIHMVADTLGELLAFGRAMGLRPELVLGWSKIRRNPHFDLTTPEALARAKKRGAIVVSGIRLVKIAARMKVDEQSAKQLDDLFAPDDLPVLNGKTGQTAML